MVAVGHTDVLEGVGQRVEMLVQVEVGLASRAGVDAVDELGIRQHYFAGRTAEDVLRAHNSCNCDERT